MPAEQVQQPVALELVHHGALHLGERELDALRGEVGVEALEHVGGRRVDVGHRLGRHDDAPHRASVRAAIALSTRSSNTSALAKNSGASQRYSNRPGTCLASGLRLTSW